jgi:hypothetical protein
MQQSINLWIQLPCCHVISSMPIEGAIIFTYEQKDEK